MIKNFKLFENKNDPYDEENWEDKQTIFSIHERDFDEIGYVMASNEDEAKDKALKLGIFKAENSRYVSADEFGKDETFYIIGGKKITKFNQAIERAQENYNRAKIQLDTLLDCIEKLKNQK